MKREFLLLVPLLAFVAGCAQERAPINRLQANSVDKHFFLGQDMKSIDDDPEFYMRGTVVDVGYGAAQDGLMTSTYAQPISRIRWEVTEDYLNARLSYERIAGTDGKGNKYDGVVKKTTNDGQIVASYKILSHFDVKREYNSTTGEALNVIGENTTDRPWYEREFMHVDWSSNLVTDAYEFDTLSMIGIYGGVTYEPMSYYVADSNDPNAPKFDTQAGYFDITVKAFAKPGVIDLSSLGWGIDKFPACMLPPVFNGGTEPYGNCNPVEVTIRQSFRKVVDTDYEPMDHDGIRFQAFGAFNMSVRQGYAWNYGLVDDQWYRFQARYNLWERSHYYVDPEKMTEPVACGTVDTTQNPTGKPTADPNRSTDSNYPGTADECKAVADALDMKGSKCDVFKKRCTLPFRARKSVTIPWYIGGNTDEDLFEASNWAVQEWNVALLTAIQTARLVECRKTKSANCEADYPMWTGQQEDYDEAIVIYREAESCYRQNGWEAEECKSLIDDLSSKLASERGGNDTNALAIGAVLKQQPVLVFCHNPVIASDHPACGGEGLAPRLGDIRYNIVLNIPKPQQPSAWGIMVDGDDPLTGEKVAASINIWSYITDIYAQQLVDLVRYMNGELKTEDVTNGQYIHDWVQASRLQAAGGGTIAKDEVRQRLAAAAKLTPTAFTQSLSKAVTPDLRLALAGAQNKVLDVATHASAPSQTQIEAAARLSALRGTTTESKLINPAMQQLSGIDATKISESQALSLASPLGLNNPKLRAQLRHMRENNLAARGACILDEAPEPSGLTAVATIMKKKFPMASKETDVQKKARYDAMYRYARRRFHYGVISHEMGHSVGHRHNFVSSYGSLFFRPQYWQLRTKNGAVTTACTEAVTDGSTCIGPRYYDPVTSEEQDQLIWMFATSSTMDYPGDVSMDMMALGMYDFAATRFFYGDTVPVYKDEDLKAGSKIGIGLTNATDTFGGLVGIRYEKPGQYGPEPFHYSQLQNEWKLIQDCHNVTPTAPTWWNAEKDGVWDPVLDGHIVSINGKSTKCRQRAVDYVAWNDLRMPTDTEIGKGYYRGGPSVDAQNRLRVPYHFATDHWADLGNLSVFRHDAGADPYEQAMFLINTQETRHIFDNFRRNRTTFNVRAAADRSFSRYNEKLVGIAGGIAFYNTIYQNYFLNTGYSFESAWPLIVDETARDQVLAASVVFDHFTRQLTRPEHGPHYQMKAVFKEPVLRSAMDADGSAQTTLVLIPNGTTGYMRDIGIGGHPLENSLSDNHGDFDTEYTVNAGSYYDKINSIIHMSISEDRFISQSRQDFYDARFRANGMADIYPEGYRRVIANSLTNDRSVLAPRLAADTNGKPLLNTVEDPLDPNATQYPAKPMGWLSMWPVSSPAVCFPSEGRNVCRYDYSADVKLHPDLPANTVAVDPQIGFEVQKFIITNALSYIPANEQTKWVDMMTIWWAGPWSTPPDYRIEFEDPTSGQVYFAKTYGTECIGGSDAACTGGKFVQKGIGARILEYANYLVQGGYKLNTTACPQTSRFPAGFDKNGRACYIRQLDGTPVVLSDPAALDAYGRQIAGCDQNIDPTCKPLTINDNHFAWQLVKYKSVPDFLMEALIGLKFTTGHKLGLY